MLSLRMKICDCMSDLKQKREEHLEVQLLGSGFGERVSTDR